jgi:hypothetical protein
MLAVLAHLDVRFQYMLAGRRFIMRHSILRLLTLASLVMPDVLDSPVGSNCRSSGVSVVTPWPPPDRAGV